MIEAAAGNQPLGTLDHSRLDRRRKVRWVLESLEADRPGIHHRVDNPHQRDLTVLDETVDRHLLTLERSLGNEKVRRHPAIRVGVKPLLKRAQEQLAAESLRLGG